MNTTVIGSRQPSAKGLRFLQTAFTQGATLSAIADRLRRRSWLVRIAAIVAACGFWVGTANAQLSSYSYSSGTYTQNFSSLGTNNGSTWSGGAGPAWSLGASYNDNTGSVAGWNFNETGGSGNVTVSGGNPSATTGHVYNFYDTSSPTDNALGGIETNKTGTITLSLILYNNTSNTYGSAALSYTGQEWWKNGTAQTLDVSTQVESSLPTSLTSGTFNAGPSALNYTTTDNGGSGSSTVSAASGPTGSDTSNLTGTITGINWTPGTYLVVDWTETSSGGSSGVGITNVNFTPNIGADLTWNGTSGEAWDTSHSYWLNSGNASTFTSNGTDQVTFGNTGVGSVVVQSGGVNPSSTIVSNTSGTYTFSDNDGTNGIGGSGSLTMNGAGGTLVLNGPNSYSGGTVINAGTLNTGTAGDAGLGQAGAGISLGGGTLQLASGFGDSTRGITLSASTSSTIDLGSTNQSVTFSGGLTGALTAGLTLTGHGTVNISGTYGTALGPMGVSSASGNLELSPTNSPTIDMVLPTSSAFTGNLTIGGTAVFALLGSATSGTPGVISGGGDLNIAANNVVMEADHSGSYGPGNVVIGNNIVMNTTGESSPFNFGLGATSGYTLTVNGTISDSYNSETGIGAANLYLENTNAAGGGGKGEVILDGTLSYHGETVIDTAKAGIVQLGLGVSLPATTALVFGDGTSGSTPGALDLNGNSFSIASLSTNLVVADTSAAIINTSETPSTLTINGSANTTYSAVIGGGASNNDIGLTLASANTGSLNLTGVNTYTGPTNVNGGLLSVNGTLSASSAVTVGSGGTLGGGIDLAQGGTIDGTLHAYAPSATIGNIQGSVTVESGGTLSPGNSVGTLTVGSLSLDSGSMLHYEFNTTTPSNDLTNVTTSGGLSVTGGSFDLVLENTSTPFDTPGTYYLITYLGALTGSVGDLSVSDPQAGYSYTFSTVSGLEGPLNAVELVIAPVPEPSTWATLLIGAASVGLWSLRRRNRRGLRPVAA